MIGKDETVFISLGGSIIYPDIGLNIPFLAQFNDFIRKQLAKTKRRFLIMVGGGHIGREYQYANQLISSDVLSEDLNWLGVHGTRLNGHLLRTIFRDIAFRRVIVEFDKVTRLDASRVVICAGGKPGRSTDSDMTLLSQKYHIKKAISLINVPFIYEKDPAIFPKAKTFTHLTWKKYREMIGNWWSPTLQLPFDPFAAKMADEIGLTAIFIKGDNLVNLEQLMAGKPFVGTTISNQES